MYDRYEQKSSHAAQMRCCGETMLIGPSATSTAQMRCCGATALDPSEPNLSTRHEEKLEVDICAVSLDNLLAGRRLTADITVDSGAGKSVMNPDAVPEYTLQESPGQLQG